MKYKVGDKVIIQTEKYLKSISVEYDTEDIHFGYDSFVHDMKRFCGKEVTIENIFEYPTSEIINFTIKECNDYNYYSDWVLPSTKATRVLYGVDNESD